MKKIMIEVFKNKKIRSSLITIVIMQVVFVLLATLGVPYLSKPVEENTYHLIQTYNIRVLIYAVAFIFATSLFSINAYVISQSKIIDYDKIGIGFLKF